MKLANNIREKQESIAYLQGEKKRLEALVAQQTNQLRKIDEKLQREIAQREKVEETLCQHLAAVDVTTDGIALLDRDGKYTYLNKAHVELFGYDNAQELLGEGWQKLYYPEQICQFDRDIFPILLQEGNWQGEATAKKKDGSTFAEEVSLTFTAEGCLICVCRDITERKKTEAALRASEARFRATFEQVAVGMTHADPDNRYLRVNQKFCDIVGYTQEELLTKTFVDITHPDDIDADDRHVKQLLAGEIDTFSIEKRYFRKDGSIIWVNLTGSLVYKPSGELDYFVGVIEEITERKRTEAALQESEERFRQMAEKISEVFWMTDVAKNNIMYISPAYEEIWNRSCDSLYENPQSFVLNIHPEDRDRVVAALAKQPLGEYDEEYRILQPNGQERWIRDRAFPIKNSAGEVDRIVGIAEDITEYKKTEQEVRLALAKEQELNELKSRFMSMTSHEFRTPLTTILSSAELLKNYSHKLSDEKKQIHLARIQVSVQNLIQMLNDILLLGKAEAGKLEFNPELIDLREFCQGLVEEFQLGVNDRLSLVFTDECPLSSVYMDEKLLGHILNNLITNAIKYSPAGSVVNFQLIYQDKSVIFRVQDSGIGIPQDELTHLFESFYRAKNVGNIPGTGLGLPIVKKAVDLHGGIITVDSEVGVGTTFTVTIPSLD